MKISRWLRVLGGSLAIAIFSSLATGITPAVAQTAESTYIIQVPEAQSDELLAQLDELGVAPTEVYDDALNGVAVSLTPTELGDVRASVSGELIEPDRPVEILGVQPSAPWNLSMLDFESRPADSQYAYPASGGAGARVYIIDTGIAPNSEFGSRLAAGATFINDDYGTTDCHGHGTHVAGTVASATYGVAKNATVVPVRVFNCVGQGGFTSSIVAGINWAIADKPAGTVGVINLSLGSPCRAGLPCAQSDAMLTAVENAISAGFVVAVAAGNSAADACRYTPAASPNALTVGAVDRNDTEASFSNFGPCVDLFAPGVDIMSLNLSSSTSTTTMSGTSMASPHAAGVAALYIGSNPGATASDVTAAVKSAAATNLVTPYPTHLESTRSELSIAAFLNTESATIPPLAPSGLVATTTGLTTVALAWQPSMSSSPLTDYVVSYRTSGSTTWTTAPKDPSLTPSFTVSGLTPGKTYDFRVSAVTNVVGPPSATARTTTWSGLPSQVSGLIASLTKATSIVLSWISARVSGSTVTDYEVQYRTAGTSTWTPLNDGISTDVTSTVAGLSPSTTHEFRVRAKSTVGTGPWSSAFRATTSSGIPATVTSLSSTSISANDVSLSWTEPTSNGADITDYIVEYKRSSVSNWSTFSDGVSTAANARVTGLTPGASYNFRVTAKTTIATGAASAPIARTVLSGKPRAVTTLTISPRSTSFVVNWAPAPENGAVVVDYLIDYRPTTTTSWTRFADGVNPTPGTTITGLSAGATYYVRVLPVSSYGSGTATTAAARTLP